MTTETSYNLDILYEIDVPALPAERIFAAITDVLTSHQVLYGTGITLIVVDDAEIRRLNLQYRGVDAPTDVLSFSADPLPKEITDEPPYLGDLIVGYPYTKQQAIKLGHALDDELVLLAIHGTLHLLGYDHDNEDNQRSMWAAQQAALRQAGVAIEVPLFTFEDDTDD